MNVKKLMEQARGMQERMEQELDQLVVEASVGGGAVGVTMSGRKQLLSVSIDPAVLDSNEAGDPDVAMLQDLVLAAVNEAGRQVDEQMQSKLGGLMPGMPGMS